MVLLVERVSLRAGHCDMYQIHEGRDSPIYECPVGMVSRGLSQLEYLSINMPLLKKVSKNAFDI